MKTEFINYLNSIGVAGLFQERVKEVYLFYKRIITNPIQDIFVSEYVDAEGRRQYENMWLFSSTSCFEAKKFLTDDIFDEAPFVKKIDRWWLEKKEYDFETATTRSRMTLDATLGVNVRLNMKASGDNCNYLKAIFTKYILPNVIN